MDRTLLNQRTKFGTEILMHYRVITVLVLGHFLSHTLYVRLSLVVFNGVIYWCVGLQDIHGKKSAKTRWIFLRVGKIMVFNMSIYCVQIHCLTQIVCTVNAYWVSLTYETVTLSHMPNYHEKRTGIKMSGKCSLMSVYCLALNATIICKTNLSLKVSCCGALTAILTDVCSSLHRQNYNTQTSNAWQGRMYSHGKCLLWKNQNVSGWTSCSTDRLQCF